jgi:uncharacterized membrane protein YphA (DoxX/SURF4 family)
MFAPQVGRRVFGLGTVALGLVGLAWGDYGTVWQPDPRYSAGSTGVGYLVACAPLLAGLALCWGRTARGAAAVLAALYGLAVVGIDLPRAFAHPTTYVAWYAVAEPLALAAGAVLAYGRPPALRAGAPDWLAAAARRAFGACLLCFGAAHLVYRDYTAALVPGWLPPGREFWTYATAAGHAAAGIAMLSGRSVRVAGVLLTAMFVIFGLLVHAPSVYLAPHSHANWSENAINLALIGAAWLSASSAGTGADSALARLPG